MGTEDKLRLAALTGKILTAIAKGIAKQGADLLPMEIIGPIGNVLKEQGTAVIETGKQMLEKSKDAGKEIIESGKDLGKDIGGALKGILGGKKDK